MGSKVLERFLSMKPGQVVIVSEVDDPERFVKYAKEFISIGGQVEFNADYSKLRCIFDERIIETYKNKLPGRLYGVGK